ncbi:hypothetical protein RhiirA4_465064 [Rhizophagus irregularis]|uniref:Uncharacterized protein n=1 Tax=Rhizophagus irregularis TaxID=588596 RepID=A0A2I1GRC2_9GLOM|nr:hypothetical protein RhiirA4_465064 [Rhizophagus irregularis]
MDNNMKSQKPCSLEWNKLFTDFYEVEATSEILRNEIAEAWHGNDLFVSRFPVTDRNSAKVNENTKTDYDPPNTSFHVPFRFMVLRTLRSNNTTGSRASSTEKLLTHVDDDFDYLYGIMTSARDWHFLLYSPGEINQASENPHTIKFNKKALDKRF